MLDKITKNIPNHWKTDSFRMEIPTTDCEVSSEFYDKYVLINANTGEEVENFKKKQALEHTVDGVTYYSWLYTRYDVNKKEYKEYVVFLVNAKMLFKDYFLGITWTTIKDLYIKLMSLNHFYIEYKDFLKCYVYDVDFCKDFTATNESIMWYKDKYTYTNKYYVHSWCPKNVFETLQFNTRERSTISAPNAKYYSKYNEQKSQKRKHVKEFYLKNGFKINDLKGVYRFEYNMKNKSSLDRWHSSGNRLEDILNITKDKHNTTAKNIHLLYTDGYKMIFEGSDITGLPAMIKWSVKEAKKQNKPYIIFHEELKEFLQICTKSTRNRILQFVKEEYDVVQKAIEIPEVHQKDVDQIEIDLFGETI